ncbi:glycine betaine ABC transporter substrate-binding protein [Aminiphilus sp.]|uniref:glycine betaine ABC transporter substrate-binding protein n=1 Tax=Aminiphilus sp. TaxID=1872488 RepID=UPI0026037981|nr:glycine betaine ABC transporter substrate-binding protein [Aminiphilus sp.]
MRRRGGWMLAAVLAVALFAAPLAAAEKFVVGSKAFTEQLILGKFAAVILRDLGFDVEEKIPLGGTNIVRQALESRQIHGYVEYTGTAATVFFKAKDPFPSGQATYEFVRDQDAPKGLVWLPPMAFNNTYCLMLRAADAERLGISTTSELAAYVNANPKELKFGVTNEFFARPDGLPKLLATYEMKPEPRNLNQMEPGLIYLAVKDGSIDVGTGFTTDGRIRAYNLKVLEDDRNMYPVYNPCFVLHKDILDKHPEIAEPFAKLGALLDEETVTELNYQATEGNRAPGEIVEEFLKRHGIIK